MGEFALCRDVFDIFVEEDDLGYDFLRLVVRQLFLALLLLLEISVALCLPHAQIPRIGCLHLHTTVDL